MQRPEPNQKRIAKFLSRAGICSRREAEQMILNGRVSVDGRVLDSPAFLVNKESSVLVDGKLVSENHSQNLGRYHKPSGLLTTHHDPQGRETVFSSLPGDLGRVISVGRLDLNSEGLLLLTNDGELSRFLEKSNWLRKYRVRVYGRPNIKHLNSLSNGITLDGINYKGIKVELTSQKGSNAWLQVALTEGKNKEIRRILSHFDLQTNRLIRTAFGPFQLGSLKRKHVSRVSPKVIHEQIGKYAKDHWR